MIEGQAYPLVSCLCVAGKNVATVKRAINCFLAQEYSNRELIIIFNSNFVEVSNFLKSIQDPRVICHENEKYGAVSMGELRNKAITVSNGKYFCQWNDKDWHHASRLSVQIGAAVNHYHPASILTSRLLYDQKNKVAYFSSVNPGAATVLCSKDVISDNIKYAPGVREDDAYLVQMLMRKSRVFPVVSPNLYIDVFQDDDNHREEFTKHVLGSKQLTQQNSRLLDSILSGECSVEEGSSLLKSEILLNDIDFFSVFKSRDEAI